MRKSIERIIYTAIFTGALLSIQNNVAYAKSGDVYDLSTGYKFAKEYVTNNNSVVSFLEEKIQQGDRIVKELPDNRFIYVEGFKKDYQKYLKIDLSQEEALAKAIDDNLITNQDELDKIKNSLDFFAQDINVAVEVNGDIVRVKGNTLSGDCKALINIYDSSDREVYIAQIDENENGAYEYIFDFAGNESGEYKVTLQDDILGNKREHTIVYRQQSIKEIPMLDDVSLAYGANYDLPKTIEVLTEDKETLEGNHIKNVMVVWDKDLDNKKVGKQEFVGKLLNTTGSTISLNVIVGEQDPKEAVNERFKTLDDLMKQDIDFVEVKTNSKINEALKSVQEALDNENLNDEQFKKTMQNKVNTHAATISKINVLKNDIESFEELLVNGDFTDREVDTEYNGYYEKLVNLHLKFNKATATNVRARKESADKWYTKNSYEFNKIKYKITSDLYILHRDMSYLSSDKKQDRYDKIEKFRDICNSVGDLDAYRFNKPTTESLKNRQKDLINSVESIIVENGSLKLNQSSEENRIEAKLVGIKVDNLQKYKIEILDEDGYGTNVKVSSDGVVSLDSDKGKDDNSTYEQIILVKDALWNIQAPIKVIITDCPGKDTFEITVDNSNKIVSLEQFDTITLRVGDNEYKLPTQVKAKMLDNTEVILAVKWDKELSTSDEGTLEFIGTVEGTTLTTSITVVVREFTELELVEYYTEILEKQTSENVNLSNSDKLEEARVALEKAKLPLQDAPDGKEKEALQERIDACEKIIAKVIAINSNIETLKSKAIKLVSNNYNHIKEYQDIYEAIEEQLAEDINNITKNSYLETIKTNKKSVREKIYFIGNIRIVANYEQDAIKVIFAGQEITDLSNGYSATINDMNDYGKKVSIDLETGKVTLSNDMLSNNERIYIQEISVKNNFWDISSNIYVEIKDVKDEDIILVTNIKSIDALQDVNLDLGEECELSDTVTGKDINGATLDLKVQWDYSKVNIHEEGEYRVIGRIQGSYRTIEVKVNVKAFTLEQKLKNKMDNLNNAFADSVDLSVAINMQMGEKAIVDAEEIIAQVEAEGTDVSEERVNLEKAKIAVIETKATLQLVVRFEELLEDDLSDSNKLSQAETVRTDCGYKLYWDKDGSKITGKVPEETERSLYSRFNSKFNYVTDIRNIDKEVKNLSKALEELRTTTTDENTQKFNNQYNKVIQLDFTHCSSKTLDGFMNKITAIKADADNIINPPELTIESILPMDSVNVEVNSEYKLPYTVKAKMSNEAIKDVNVTWTINGEVITTIKPTEIEILEVVGTVEGFDGTITLTINVIEEVIESELDKLNKSIEELNRIFTDNIDLTVKSNMDIVEENIKNAKIAIGKVEEDTIVQQGVINRSEVCVNETKQVLKEIEDFNRFIEEEDLSSCRYTEWGEGQSRIEELNTMYTDIGWKIIWPGDKNIKEKITEATQNTLKVSLNLVEDKHHSIKGNVITELKNIEELNSLLQQLKEDPTNMDNYNLITNKLNEEVNYNGLNEATINGFKAKRIEIKTQVDNLVNSESELDKLNSIIEQLSLAIVDGVDLTISENMIKAESDLDRAVEFIKAFNNEDVVEQQKIINTAELIINKVKEVENLIVELQSFTNDYDFTTIEILEYDGEKYIPKIADEIEPLAIRLYEHWESEEYCGGYLPVATFNTLLNQFQKIERELNSREYVVIDIMYDLDILRQLLSDVQSNPINENYEAFMNKYNNLSDYYSLNETTIQSIEAIKEELKVQADLAISAGQTNSNIEDINNDSISSGEQASKDSKANQKLEKESEVLGLKRAVINNIQEFIKKISRKIK